MKNIIKTISKYFSFAGKKEFYIKLAVAVLLFVSVFLLSTDKYRKKRMHFKVGEIAPYDIKINKDIEYVDHAETQKGVQSLISNVAPVFSLNTDILTGQEQGVFDFFSRIEKLDAEPRLLAEKVQEMKKTAPAGEDELLSRIFMIYKSENLKSRLLTLLRRMHRGGVTDMSVNDFDLLSRKGVLMKVYQNEDKEEVSVTVNKKDIFFADEMNSADLVRRLYPGLSQNTIQVFASLLKLFVKPNLLYNKSETDKRIMEIINLVKPVKKRLKQGQVVIRYGQEITEADFNILKEIVKYSTEQNKIDAYFILLLLVFILTFLMARLYLPGILANLKRYLFLTSFIFLASSLNYVFMLFNNLLSPRISNSSFIPIAGFAILIASMADYAVSYFVIFFLSILTMFITGFSFMDFMSVLTVGIFTIILSGRMKRRSSIWTMALLVGFFYLLLGIVHSQISNLDRNILFNFILIGFINGIVSIALAIGLYPLFENLFNIVTDYRLIELSDLNSPIMKKLLIEAPGTYHHSIITANLAETAALTIGANSLLARVCGYYHDIGKLENPEYFIENQMGEENRHNSVKPSISCSIIKSHIKYGIEVARKLKLPEEVQNAIREHHGTTMIHYFYKRALMDKETEKMSKEDLIAIYRHDGPLPRTKESAIIMLADAVEAATRSLKKPSFSRIETIIREIMNARFLDGQLNDCPLTLKDLENITNSFIQFLSAMYHTRIEYPDKDEIKKLENEY